MPKNALRYASKNPVCARMVFVDGLARCAKFLTCRVLSHLKGCEHWQYPVAIEHMCYLVYLDGIDDAVAAPFVQFIAEEHAYNRMIGRFLNTRADDASSIFKCPDHAEYLRRAAAPGGMEAVERFNGANRVAAFQSHNAMAAGPFLFKALPAARMVHICRHPVDQAYKWIERGWGRREIEDPLSFVPLVEVEGKTVPWFARDWAGEYLAGNPAERAVDSVIFLQEADEKGLARLDAAQAGNVHRIVLEKLVTEPEPVIAGIAGFLDCPQHDAMNAMLREERVPRVLDRRDRQRMFREIAAQAAADKAGSLLAASRAFERRWDLEPFDA